MEKIEVSADMRERILAGIQKEFTAGSVQDFSLLKYRRYLAAAACAAIFLIGLIFLPQLIKNWSGQEPELSQGNFAITEAADGKELEQIVGFGLPDLEQAVPGAEEAFYCAYGRDMAEIVYQSSKQRIVFRKSLGSEDNSGDYIAYPVVLTRNIAGQSVTIKGEADLYRLAVWADGQFSYSVRLEQAVSAEEIAVIVQKLAE